MNLIKIHLGWRARRQSRALLLSLSLSITAWRLQEERGSVLSNFRSISRGERMTGPLPCATTILRLLSAVLSYLDRSLSGLRASCLLGTFLYHQPSLLSNFLENQDGVVRGEEVATRPLSGRAGGRMGTFLPPFFGVSSSDRVSFYFFLPPSPSIPLFLPCPASRPACMCRVQAATAGTGGGREESVLTLLLSSSPCPTPSGRGEEGASGKRVASLSSSPLL